MEIHSTTRFFGENGKKDVDIERKISYEVWRDGEPVEIQQTTIKDVTAYLEKIFAVTSIEQYVDSMGNKVYSGEGVHQDKKVLFWVHEPFYMLRGPDG